MSKTILSMLIVSSAVLMSVPGLTWRSVSAAHGQVTPAANASPPDFSGVYYPAQEGGGGAAPAGRAARGARPAGPPGRPTRGGPVGDLSQGRAANAPELTPEYLARWEVIRKSRIAGSYEYDNSAKCLPPGMPAMMNMAYGMEIMQTKDRITFSAS